MSANFTAKSLHSHETASRLEEPGRAVSPLDEGYLVELGPDLAAQKEDFAAFSKARSEAREIMGLDMFQIRDEP